MEGITFLLDLLSWAAGCSISVCFPKSFLTGSTRAPRTAWREGDERRYWTTWKGCKAIPKGAVERWWTWDSAVPIEESHILLLPYSMQGIESSLPLFWGRASPLHREDQCCFSLLFDYLEHRLKNRMGTGGFWVYKTFPRPTLLETKRFSLSLVGKERKLCTYALCDLPLIALGITKTSCIVRGLKDMVFLQMLWNSRGKSLLSLPTEVEVHNPTPYYISENPSQKRCWNSDFISSKTGLLIHQMLQLARDCWDLLPWLVLILFLSPPPRESLERRETRVNL